MPTALNSAVGTVQKMAFSDRCHARSAKMVRLFLATLMRVCLVSKPRQLEMLLRPPPFSRTTETKGFSLWRWWPVLIDFCQVTLVQKHRAFSDLGSQGLSLGDEDGSVPCWVSAASNVYHQNDKSSSRRVLQPVTPPHMSNLCHPPCLTFGSALRYRSNSVSK